MCLGRIVQLLFGFLWCISMETAVEATAALPNIVIHLADDLGIGDIGCYGNTTLRTPNIDRLAEEGILLTEHFAAESTCTPSRAAILTGRYPIRTGMVPGLTPVKVTMASAGGLPEEEVTFAEQAKKAGYQTALIGKWHLGIFDFFRNPVYHPMNQGFDRFYGIPLSLTAEMGDGPITLLRFYPYLNNGIVTILVTFLSTLMLLRKIKVISLMLCIVLSTLTFLILSSMYAQVNCGKFLDSVLMRNHTVVEKPMRLVGLTQRFAQEGVEFIRDMSGQGKPFLLFMSWGHPHVPLAPSVRFSGKAAHGRYGDCVEELDWGIGLVNDVLNELNISRNTLVYFTSDNGGDVWEDGGFNGKYRGGKGYCTVDGGTRSPGLMRFPERIPPKTNSNVVTSHLDIFPLISHLAGVPLPDDRYIDGENILQLLEGRKSSSTRRKYLMHYSRDELTAVRYMPEDGNVWKVAFKIPDSLFLPGTTTCHIGICNCKAVPFLDSPLLYDMSSDTSETRPMKRGDHPDYDEIVGKVAAAVKEHQSTIVPVPSEMSFLKTVWLPHLIACCNWPVCQCTEPKYSDAELK